MIDIPVLISGGGPVGLTASLLLSQHRVRSLLVERHPSTALTPKARGINARTMELFRQCGIEAAVRQGWDAIIGTDGAFIGMTSFGASAPAKDLYKHFGITVDAIVAAATR